MINMIDQLKEIQINKHIIIIMIDVKKIIMQMKVEEGQREEDQDHNQGNEDIAQVTVLS